MHDPCARWREMLHCDSIIGRSSALAEVLADAWTAAQCDLSVLLLGESGTGKNQLASAIHDASARAGRPFETVSNSVPDGLFEGQFFGAEKGAFTGAVQRMEGAVERAEGGTLFIDEVGGFGSVGQVKLLRLLQFRRWAPLGSSREREANVRVIAATNAPVEHLRRDMYHRLAAFSIRMPALAERVDDIGLISKAIVANYAAKRRRPPLPLSPQTVQVLLGRAWPGNVRELENILQVGLERAWVGAATELAPHHVSTVHRPPRTHPRLRDQLHAFESWLVDEAMSAARGRVAQAAGRLGVSESWLYKHLAQRLRRPAA